MVRLASEQFCKKNTNCSIQDSLKRIQDVIQCALERDIAVRGYVSCVVGCPYQVCFACLLGFLGIVAAAVIVCDSSHRQLALNCSVCISSASKCIRELPSLHQQAFAAQMGTACIYYTHHTGMQKANYLEERALSWKSSLVNHHHGHHWRIIVLMQGHVKPETAAEIACRLWEMGCYEVSMGDTIGVGTPASVSAMFKVCPWLTWGSCHGL